MINVLVEGIFFLKYSTCICIQLLLLEEPNIKIYRCVKVDIDRHEAEVIITFHN